MNVEMACRKVYRKHDSKLTNDKLMWKLAFCLALVDATATSSKHLLVSFKKPYTFPVVTSYNFLGPV